MLIVHLLLLFQAYMSQMQSQWSWLLQLSVCLDAHVKHASAYYQVRPLFSYSIYKLYNNCKIC